MVERILVAVGLIVVGAGLYLAWTRWQVWRLRNATVSTPGLEALRPGKPAILYFTSPGCVPCKTTQRPAIEALQAEMGDALQVLTIDATARPDAADHWGVISVPTTFVLDRTGRARRVNHGVAGADKLRLQLDQLAGVDEETAVEPQGAAQLIQK